MNELTTTNQNPFVPTTMEEAEKMASWIAASGCFGISKKEQALTLMLLAHEEGKTLSQMLKEVHVFDTGKLSQRADFTQTMFQKTGTILWHLRTNSVVAGSFFSTKPIDDDMRNRACQRFELQYELDIMQMQPEWDRKRESELMLSLSKLAREGEATIIRTLAAAEASGITMGKNGVKNNWAAGSISMLQWRCVTDGVKLIDPSVMSGLSSDVDLQDARTVEMLNLEKRASTINPADRESIVNMIAQHKEMALEATSTVERNRLLGLAAELQAKLDGGEKPVFAPNAAVVDADTLPGLEPAVEAALETIPPEEWRSYKITVLKTPQYRNKKLTDFDVDTLRMLHDKRSVGFLNNPDPDVRKEAQMIKAAWEELGK